VRLQDSTRPPFNETLKPEQSSATLPDESDVLCS